MLFFMVMHKTNDTNKNELAEFDFSYQFGCLKSSCKIPPNLPFPSGSETALGRRPKGGKGISPFWQMVRRAHHPELVEGGGWRSLRLETEGIRYFFQSAEL